MASWEISLALKMTLTDERAGGQNLILKVAGSLIQADTQYIDQQQLDQGVFMERELTSFLHEREKVIQEVLPVGVAVQLVKL
jgi:hypothetical protein